MSTDKPLTIRDYLNRTMDSARQITRTVSSNSKIQTNRRPFRAYLSTPGIQKLGSIDQKTTGLTLADYRARPILTQCFKKDTPQSNTVKGAEGSLSQTNKKLCAEILKQSSVSAKDLAESGNDRISGNSKPIMAAPSIHSVSNQQAQIESHVKKAAQKYNLPPALIKGVIKAESNFCATAVSQAGAQGLMQLMPATAKELGVNDSFDIGQNIDGGACYLRQMMDRFDGDVKTALAAYNAGPGTVDKYDGNVPYQETKQYVKRVLRFSEQMA